jgi:hypothetical protein
MATTGSGESSQPASWKPDPHGLRITRQTVGREPAFVSLHHPTSPLVIPFDDGGREFVPDEPLRALALDYLNAITGSAGIEPQIELPEHWLKALFSGADDSTFGWLPIMWPAPDIRAEDAGNPYVSFQADRQAPGDDERDRTVILLASERLDGKVIGSGFGFRLVVHIQATEDGKFEAHFTGLTASLPYGPYARGLWTEPWAASSLRQDALFRAIHDDAVTRNVAAALGLEEGSVRIRGARISRIDGQDDWRVERHGTGVACKAGGQNIGYSFVAVGTPTRAGSVVSKEPMIADATAGEARVFPIDPASQGEPRKIRKRRPSRPDETLDQYRDWERILPGKHGELVLEDEQHHELLRVTVCPDFVLEDRGALRGSAKPIDLPGDGPEIRSNDFAAVSAFYNGRNFFDRLEAYGLHPFNYFRIASLPLKLAYRSGLRYGPGKDGETVNARVLVEGWKSDSAGPTRPGERPGVEIHLAMADLTRRGRKPWDGQQRSPAIPLGIAAAARWVWHELGHVVLVARAGVSEFRFAHSPGDALAAIVSDPDSNLATDGNWRGATFPWVSEPRRHDRCVAHGWSWGGTMHRDLADAPVEPNFRRLGYWSEQILSSSLFRLYRCLGGDTMEVGDESVRQTASHYAVYLILRGIELLEPPFVVAWPNDPDQIVDAMTDADTGTGRWRIRFPKNTGPRYLRIGGCAHKLIRWAFEAQGLYAPPDELTNAPGLPPPVDVYIDDGRPRAADGIGYGPGSYLPVSLHWDRNQAAGDPVPRWQASGEAIAVNGSDIRVTVGNRGTQPASDVRVSVWWRAWPANTDPPTWRHGIGWTPCTPAVSAGQTIGASATATFGPFTHQPPGGRYLVLAQATCGGDRANTDPASNMPCSQRETPLRDLVAGDNNLGLRVM